MREPQGNSASQSALSKDWQVFISYAREDMAQANRINAALKDAGIVSYQDVRNTPGGARWRSEIVAAIEQSKVLLVLLTAHSLDSDQVPKEVDVALRSGKRVVPVWSLWNFMEN